MIATPSSLASSNGTVPRSRVGSSTPTAKSDRGKPYAPTSLTELEVQGRNTLPLALGDGHAAQYDEAYAVDLTGKLGEFDRLAHQHTDWEAETELIRAMSGCYGQSMLIGNNLRFAFKTQVNASRSIDNVLTLAKRRGWNCQMICPVFDNLYLYGIERGVEITPLPEERLRAEGAIAIDTAAHNMVFLVSPNNPTGETIDAATFREIARKCARDGVTLVIDASFRAYDESGTDHYDILADEGTSFVAIEDTGKINPCRERKVSVISYSNNLKHDLDQIVEIDVLGPVAPNVWMNTYLFKEMKNIGLDLFVRNRVRQARESVHAAVAGTILRPARIAMGSTLPVVLLEIMDDRFNDLDVVERLKARGLGVLAGRYFWIREEDRVANSHYIRLSLLKEWRLLNPGLETLRTSLLNDFNDRP